MNAFLLLLAVQASLQAPQAPVLEFPEAGLDDPAAYEGYATRFFRDSRGNALQVYLDRRSGRIVHVWADAVNESAALTVRDGEGRPAPVSWGGPGAVAETEGPRRVVRHRLSFEAPSLEIGWFLLGTMRQERDFQYFEWHRRPFGDEPFLLPELAGLISALESLPAEERARHLELLGARDPAELRSRLEPRVTFTESGSAWTVRVEHTSLDGRNHVILGIRGDMEATSASVSDDAVSVRSRSGDGIVLEIGVATDSEALTPLDREMIFNGAFEAYYRRHRTVADNLRRALPAPEAAVDDRVVAFRRLERGIRALELLSYEEKLMASLPNYATYFGRDMMMAAMMLEPVTSADLQERVIASVLGKLAPTGDVSHEEALGGQAIRENAAEYASAVAAWRESRERDPDAAARHLAHARELVGDLQRVRENYRMIDDDFQLPILAARYLARDDVSPDRKRRFLSGDGPEGASRFEALVRNLALVAELATPYATDPRAGNLVPFFFRDERGWLPGSWRDSGAGYGRGRFAMDVNVVWVPNALEATRTILDGATGLGLSVPEALGRASRDVSALDAWVADPGRLTAAIERWGSAFRHFEVTLTPDRIEADLAAFLATLPAEERRHWRAVLDESGAAGRPLSFLALALDEEGTPVAAPHTDVATALFLEDYTGSVLRGDTDPDEVVETVDVLVRAYPVGLHVDGLGPVIVNDAYAGSAVQERFRNDLYHSPRVVWGREVNLVFLGLARQIGAAYDPSGRLRDDRPAFRSYVATLREALDRTREAVEASGLRHNELWSYRFEGGALRPTRYGTSSDLQLWNLTDLAVGFVLEALPRP